MVKLTLNALCFLLCLLIAACSTLPSPAQRKQLSDTLAIKHGWQGESISADPFNLMAYLPAVHPPAEKLTIYIEGDGFAWFSRSQPSFDPTPLDPLALRLALAQPDGNAVYLARPCQYGDAEASNCNQRYWTKARFAPEVIRATSEAIDTLKEQFSATRLTLVGYSGGAAVAALVASRRDDVEHLISVAGNLDPQAWATLHHLQPLSDSLNPSDDIQTLKAIPQWHFAGGEDSNISPALINGFVDRFPKGRKPVVDVEPGFDHHCCWVEKWPELWWKAQATGHAIADGDE